MQVRLDGGLRPGDAELVGEAEVLRQLVPVGLVVLDDELVVEGHARYAVNEKGVALRVRVQHAARLAEEPQHGVGVKAFALPPDAPLLVLLLLEVEGGEDGEPPVAFGDDALLVLGDDAFEALVVRVEVPALDAYGEGALARHLVREHALVELNDAGLVALDDAEEVALPGLVHQLAAQLLAEVEFDVEQRPVLGRLLVLGVEVELVGRIERLLGQPALAEELLLEAVHGGENLVEALDGVAQLRVGELLDRLPDKALDEADQPLVYHALQLHPVEVGQLPGDGVERELRLGERDEASYLRVRLVFDEGHRLVGAILDLLERVQDLPTDVDLAEHPVERVAVGQLADHPPQDLGQARVADLVVYLPLDRVPRRGTLDEVQRLAELVVNRALHHVEVLVEERHGAVAHVPVLLGGALDECERLVELRLVGQRVEGLAHVLLDETLGQLVEVEAEAVEIREALDLVEELQPVLRVEADERAHEVVRRPGQALGLEGRARRHVRRDGETLVAALPDDDVRPPVRAGAHLDAEAPGHAPSQ